MDKDEAFQKFITRYKKKMHFGLGVLKGVLAVLIVIGIFIGCIWITKQQEGLMPGGTIPGEATGQ